MQNDFWILSSARFFYLNLPSQKYILWNRLLLPFLAPAMIVQFLNGYDSLFLQPIKNLFSFSTRGRGPIETNLSEYHLSMGTHGVKLILSSFEFVLVLLPSVFTVHFEPLRDDLIIFPPVVAREKTCDSRR